MKNSRWRTTAILKTVKMPYLCSCSNEIWHGDAYCSYEPDVKLKFQLPEISYGGLENKKNSLNNDTLYNKFRNKTAGWFAAERSAGRRHRSIAGAGAQQQTRAVSCWQPRDEAEYRLVK